VTAKLNARAAQIMEQFNSSAAKLNNGTIVIGGRVEAPTARKLVRLGLIERRGDFGIIYRATDAGREWLAAQICRTEGDGLSIRTSLRTVHAEICTCQV
jgi:DNA-binding PadR family transcriptional regulator